MKFQVNVARQMPSTKAVATKGATNRRSYLGSRRNSFAGKQPGANIDSLVLVILFPTARRHIQRQRGRKGERERERARETVSKTKQRRREAKRREKKRREEKRGEKKRREEKRRGLCLRGVSALLPCSLLFMPIPWSVSASVLCNFPSRRFGEYLRRDLEALINPARASRSDRRALPSIVLTNCRVPGPRIAFNGN